MNDSPFHGCKAIFFDFMGTCLDWYTGIVNVLPERLRLEERKQLAIDWRESFFQDIHTRFNLNLPQEDIDLTHARLLDALLDRQGIFLTDQEKFAAVDAWHGMTAWPDVVAALPNLVRQKYKVFVLANGTIKLQADLLRSSKLEFHRVFSSEALGETKPDPQMYNKAMELVGVKPEESIMVAAHAYDLRAANKVGMHTVYVRRWTEDTKEDMLQVEKDVDLFLGDTDESGAKDGSLEDLVELLT